MKNTENYLHNYYVMQESYLTDIDMSGGLYLEYQQRCK